MKLDLVGTKEAAELLGISRQNLYVTRIRKSDFPKPVAELAQGPVWMKKDIERWKTEKGFP